MINDGYKLVSTANSTEENAMDNVTNLNRLMTNGEYARTILPKELPLIVRVATEYIHKKVGSDAPLWEKEKAYDEWFNDTFDGRIWEKFRLERVNFETFFEVKNEPKNRVKYRLKNDQK